jgi:hypothetical protein
MSDDVKVLTASGGEEIAVVVQFRKGDEVQEIEGHLLWPMMDQIHRVGFRRGFTYGSVFALIVVTLLRVLLA